MVEKEYKNDNSDEVLKKIVDKLVEYNQSLRKIKSYLNRINLFGNGDPFMRDFKLLDEEMLKVKKLLQLPLETRFKKDKGNLFNKTIYFFKIIYFKILFFILKPFRNRLIANNLALINALKYLVDSHKRLISDTEKLYEMIKELLEEMSKSVIGISEQQDYILKKIIDS
mgnify:CR=1 FL=1